MNRIGRDRDCHAYTGCLSEVLVYDRPLSADETRDIELYLMCKWGIKPPKPATKLTNAQGSAVKPTARRSGVGSKLTRFFGRS